MRPPMIEKVVIRMDAIEPDTPRERSRRGIPWSRVYCRNRFADSVLLDDAQQQQHTQRAPQIQRSSRQPKSQQRKRIDIGKSS